MSIDSRVRHRDIAELRRLLAIFLSVTTGFAVFNLVLGVDASDRGATRAGMLLLVTCVCYALILVRIERARVDVTVGATASILVASAIFLTVVEPIYSGFAIAPLLAVGVALPYL